MRERSGYSDGKEDRDEEGADETFDGLLGAKLDELVTTERHACQEENESVPTERKGEEEHKPQT